MPNLYCCASKINVASTYFIHILKYTYFVTMIDYINALCVNEVTINLCICNSNLTHGQM